MAIFRHKTGCGPIDTCVSSYEIHSVYQASKASSGLAVPPAAVALVAVVAWEVALEVLPRASPESAARKVVASLVASAFFR